MFEFKVISDFALLSFKDIYALDELTYYYLLRNAVIHQLSLTETGRQKLEEAWVLEQTRPDYSSLSKLQGKKGVEMFGFKD